MRTLLAAAFVVLVLVAQGGTSAAQAPAPNPNAPDIENGRKVYAFGNTSCSNCHGAAGIGGWGPDLAGKGITVAQAVRAIRKPYWKTLWFICCVIAAAAAGVYFLARWWVLRVKRREQEKAKIGKLLSEFQMTALRAQMNPHFIFNAISSIQHYILQNEVQQSYNYLAKFSKLIRNVLDQSKEEELLLSAELETLQLYIELEQLRFSAPFAFELQVDEELEPDNIYIPTMLLQPFIENAIWHGLMPKKEKGTLRLLLRRVPAGLLAVIEDDGIGRAASRAAQQGKLHESKGLSISRRRLDLLNAEQEHRYTLLIEDLYDTQGGAAGTRVTLTIPVIYD